MVDESKNQSKHAAETPDRGSAGIVAPPIKAAVPRDVCTDCGISRTSDANRCERACQFIKPDYRMLEARVHGRPRDAGRDDEVHFGPYKRMLRARLRSPKRGAQSTGITTAMAERLLETGAVDAILTTAPAVDDNWRPWPVIVTRPEGMAMCRGLRVGFSPLLSLLEPVRALGHRRIGLIGVPCQVYALRALEAELGFERIYVIGTLCADNTTTDKFRSFLSLICDNPDAVTHFEFRDDHHLELRFSDAETREIPIDKLPLARLPDDFLPLSCRTCVDFTNTLADVSVGYAGGDGDQWLLVRNARGEELVSLLGDDLVVSEPRSRGKRRQAVAAYLKSAERDARGLTPRALPVVVRPFLNRMMPRFAPRGVEFARARVEMKAIETVVHLRRACATRVKNMVPEHIWKLVAPYGVIRRDQE